MPLSDLLVDLTEAQRSAVEQLDGALLVLAGPGSGKTRVITRRVANLVAHGVPAWQVLALTFTNKAAGEMRSRIEALLPADLPGRRGLVVATFHSLCARLLRRYAERAGLSPDFVIYDAADQRELVKESIEAAGVSTSSFAPAAVHGAISRAKNDLVDAGAYAAAARDFRERTIARIYSEYERRLAACAAVDFDDLLLRMARLLVGDAAVRSDLQERFRHLLIDEYQDTNRAQFIIARTIAAAHGNICVVGDPDQSIYGWRGADLSNILDFEEHFPEARIVALGENFRSTGHIVSAAAGLIGHNARRRRKELFTGLGHGSRVVVRACVDEQAEAQAVVAAFTRLAAEGMPWREMAVLYRMNALSRVLEERFRTAGVPYHIVRGTAFFDRREVRDCLAYLRLVTNPSDAVSLARIVNLPARGLGASSLARLARTAQDRRLSLLQALRGAGGAGGPEALSPRAAAAAVGFAAMIDRWRAEAVESPSTDAGALAGLVERVLDESGLREHLAKRRDQDDVGEDRLANLDELVSAAAQWEPVDRSDDGHGGSTALRPMRNLLDRLSAWLESVALVSDADAVDPARGAVTLMTLHAAKGLEFDAVAIVGLEEGLLPHSRATEDDRDFEEERRLLFVGMTRARRRLTLSCALRRVVRGIPERTMTSQFLRELPAADVEVADEAGAWGRAPRGAGRHDAAPPELDAETGRTADHDGVDDLSAWKDAEAGGAAPLRGDRWQGLVVGCLVRHPRFGYGRVQALMPRGSSSTARVAFDSAGTKNLVIERARLERVS